MSSVSSRASHHARSKLTHSWQSDDDHHLDQIGESGSNLESSHKRVTINDTPEVHEILGRAKDTEGDQDQDVT
jgi:hypothetical protein